MVDYASVRLRGGCIEAFGSLHRLKATVNDVDLGETFIGLRYGVHVMNNGTDRSCHVSIGDIRVME
jgi:hypothetical protein